MKLKRSHYNNKEVINHLKSSFSIIESAGMITTFTDTQNFLEFDINVVYKNNKYNVSLTEKGLTDYGIVISKPKTKKAIFENRTDAIKHILKKLKIIA